MQLNYEAFLSCLEEPVPVGDSRLPQLFVSFLLSWLQVGKNLLKWSVGFLN